MINATSAFKEALFNDDRRYVERVVITLEDETELDLDNSSLWSGGFSIEDSVSDDNSFSAVGSAIINKATVVLNNIYDDFSEYDFINAEFVMFVGLDLEEDGETRRELLRKGTYIVDETRYNGSIITLTGIDYMSKFDLPYSESTLEYPASCDTIVRDLCTCCGVTLATLDFQNKSTVVAERPLDEALTCREVLSYVGQLCGCYARCNPSGQLELKWFDTDLLADMESFDGGYFDSHTPYASGVSLSGGIFYPWDTGDVADGGTFTDGMDFRLSSLYSADISTDDVVITGVQVTYNTVINDEEVTQTVLSGTAGYVIEIAENPFIAVDNASTIANRLGLQLIGLKFRKMSVSHSSDPTLEAGDVVSVVTAKGNVYPILITRTTFGVGEAQKTVCGAETPARKSAARYSAVTKAYVETRKKLQSQKTTFEQALEDLSERIDYANGLYETQVQTAGGGYISYMHNKPLLAESDIQIMISDVGVTVTANGTATTPTWYGLTVDGNLISSILTTVGVNADWINTGQLVVSKNNVEQLFIDCDTGTVRIKGDTVSITAGDAIDTYVQNVADTAEANAKEYSDDNLSTYAETVATEIADIQAQLDGVVDTYYYAYAPTVSNYPANQWTTTALKEEHEGDLFLDTSTGKSYRWVYENATWQWKEIPDTASAQALVAAQHAQDTADGKRRVFVATPYPPYDQGDLWMQGSAGDIMVCWTPRSEGGSYVATDWQKMNKYTDNTATDALAIRVTSLETSTVAYYLSVSQAALAKHADGTYTPSTITLSAKQQQIGHDMSAYSGRFVIETTSDGSTWTVRDQSSTNESSRTYTIPTNIDFITMRCSLYAAGGTTTLIDQQTIPIVDSGVTGEDAYTVLLTNESHNFPGTDSHAVASSTTCGVITYKGSTQISCYVGASASATSISTGITGLSCSINANNTDHVTLTFTTTTQLTTPSGTVTIPIVADGKSFSMLFSFAIAFIGEDGERGATWYAGTSITGTDTTPRTFIGSGVTDALEGDHYLNTDTQNVYICTLGGNASTAKWRYEQNIKGGSGAPGADGEDTYFHVKYSDDGGQTFTNNSGEDPGDWIGTYSDHTFLDSTNVSDYSWAKIKGEDAYYLETPFTWNNAGTIATFTAIVYHGEEDITSGYPSSCFEWYLRTEDGENRIAVGSTCQVNKSSLGYGGTVICVFTSYDNIEARLLARDNAALQTPDGDNYLMMTQAEGDIRVVDLPIKIASEVNLDDYLMGIDAADGYQVTVQNLATRIGDVLVKKSGDTMSGVLTIRDSTYTSNQIDSSVQTWGNTYVLFRDNAGTDIGRVGHYFNGVNDREGVYIRGVRSVNGSAVNNQLGLLIDGEGNLTVAVSSAAAWRTALSVYSQTECNNTFVAKAGDTMTGDLTVGNSSHAGNVIATSSFTAGTTPSSNTSGSGLRITDKNGGSFGRWDTYYWSGTEDRYGFRFGLARTPSGGSAVGHYLFMSIAADGTRNVSVSETAVWRKALAAASSTWTALGSTVTGTTAKTLDLADYSEIMIVAGYSTTYQGSVVIPKAQLSSSSRTWYLSGGYSGTSAYTKASCTVTLTKMTPVNVTVDGTNRTSNATWWVYAR